MDESSPAPAKRVKKTKPLVGWREWVSLPDLGIPLVKAKIDTGARTSALHAFRVTSFQRNGKNYVRFFVHPVQRHRFPEIECVARVIDRREVKNTSGRPEERFVIRTHIDVGGESWPIDLTLTNRDEMGFRMLIGRAAIRKRYMVDPARSFLTGRWKPAKKKPRKKAKPEPQLNGAASG